MADEFVIDDPQVPADAVEASAVVKRNVLEALEAEGIKQSELARRLGWSRDQLNRALVSDRPLRLDEVVSIAYALSVAPLALMVPWDGATALRVRRGDMRVEMSAVEAYRWLAGVLPPTPDIDQRRYFSMVPQEMRQTDDALAALRAAHGVRMTETGVEFVDDSGRVRIAYGTVRD